MSRPTGESGVFDVIAAWDDDIASHEDVFVCRAAADASWPDALTTRPGTTNVPAGVLVAPDDPALRVCISRAAFEDCFTRIRTAPRPGSFYPRGIFAPALDVGDERRAPCRLAALTDTEATIDLNHPLAARELRVSVRERPMSMPDSARLRPVQAPVAAALADGPGIQALRRDGPDFLAGDPFDRADPGADAAFYDFTRLVYHMDAAARGEVTRTYGDLIPPGSRVLDLMSSWVSHLPAERDDLTVTGLGMNAEELAANPRLAGFAVHDLNAEPRLPYPDGHFDAVVCTSSVEYLVRPLEVFADVHRVLAPGGILANAFTDRWFPPKVVARWTELHPFERVGFVLDLYARTPGFTAPGSRTVRGLPRPADDAYAERSALADVAYLAWARKSP